MIPMDLNRILDHEVEMLGLDLERIWKVIQTFVRHCDEFSAKHGDIQIDVMKESKKFREYNPYTFFIAAREFPGQSMEIALTQILRRPRLLKQAFRRTWLAWQSLHGEVCLEDLLIYNTIHTVNSGAIDFMRDHWSGLASGQQSDRTVHKQEDMLKVWNKYMSGVDDNVKRWLWTLVGVLFPDYGNKQRSSSTQGINNERYWKRISNGRLETEGIRDQEIIRQVVQWKDSGEARAIVEKLMVDVDYTSVFEQLFEYPRPAPASLNGKGVMVLASQLFEKMLHKDGSKANHGSSPGFIPLWRLQNKRSSIVDYEGWLWKEMQKALPTSLYFQVDLEHYFGGTNSPIGQESRICLRHRIAKWAKENIKAESLCRTLPLNKACILREFILGPTQDRITPDPDWPTWEWIVPEFMKALRQDASLLIPQIVVIFIEFLGSQVDRHANEDEETEEQSNGMRMVYQLNKDWIRCLFGSRKQRSTFSEAILKPASEEETWSAEIQAMVGQFREGLRAWGQDGFE